MSDFSQGVPLKTQEQVLNYWRDRYDWRKVEARLNSYPQFITEIDGLDIHFIHARLTARGRPADRHHPRLARLELSNS